MEKVSTPEFGPRGYLPPKAAKRARKIILREQMGFGWPVAALVAALVVVVSGVLFIRGVEQPPAAPFVAIGALTEVPPGGAAVLGSGTDRAVVTRVGGALRAFGAPATNVLWCPESQRLESAGAAWRLDGRRTFGAGESLRPLPSVVYSGQVYADVTTDAPPPAPAPDGRAPACAGGG
jgi:membrane-associated protease RseP (regulator of RpoE activity)